MGKKSRVFCSNGLKYLSGKILKGEGVRMNTIVLVVGLGEGFFEEGFLTAFLAGLLPWLPSI